MLEQLYPAEKLAETLIPREGWRPFPPAGDRAAWAALPEGVRAAHVKLAEAHLQRAWEPLPATLWLDLVRTGSRARFEGPYFARRHALVELVLGECIEGEGRFLDDIANGVWVLCEESSWVVPAHLHLQKAGLGLPDTAEPVVDLFAAQTAELLAWTRYLLGPELEGVSPLLGPRIEREVRQRILAPCRDRDFHWMGLNDWWKVNNWNPWICSNWLAANLLLEADADQRVRTTARILRCLDRFLATYPGDGGCDEGPGYWGRAGASLFDCLELLQRAGAAMDEVFADAKVANIGRYVYRAHIAGPWMLNFADASPLARPDGSLVFRFGRAIGDSHMQALGAWLMQEAKVPDRGLAGGSNLGRKLAALFDLHNLPAAEAHPPLVRDVFLPDIQVMTARDQAGRPAGLYLAAKGGHNAESHNHNDVGHFLVFVDGKPVLVDAGVEVYSAKTFSAERYEIWTMQSAWHSLPQIGAVQQQAGEQFAARDVLYHADDQEVVLRLDLAGAYPAEARLRRWQRTLRLERGRQVEVIDEYALEQPAESLRLYLLTACDAGRIDGGRVELEARQLPAGRATAAAVLEVSGPAFTLAAEAQPITDPNLSAIWGSHLTRLAIHADRPPREGTFTVRVTPRRTR